MPTHEETNKFWSDYDRLTDEQRAAFSTAVKKLVEDLRAGVLRKGLRVKRVQGTGEVWEMTWAADGRALFTYGPGKAAGDPHVIWLRIDTHDIFNNP